MLTQLNICASKLLNIVNKILPEDTIYKLYEGGTTQTKKVTSLAGAADKFKTIVQNVLGPILLIIGVLGVIYAVYLGVMYAKAESAEKRKEIQGRLIGACIGAVIIIAGATLCFALDWAAIYHNFSVSGHSFVDANKDGICDSCPKN